MGHKNTECSIKNGTKALVLGNLRENNVARNALDGKQWPKESQIVNDTVWILPTLITAIIRCIPPASCKVGWIQPSSSPFDFAHVTRMAPSVVKSTETRGASIPKQATSQTAKIKWWQM